MYKRKVHVLFLDSGNSYCSQMAEAYASQLGAGLLEAKSAEIEAHDKDPRVISVMQEDGIDISSQESTVVTEEMLEWADLVVTLSANADQQCPVIPAGAQKKHWPLPDPSKTNGSEEVILHEFRAVRDEVKRRVNSMIGGIKMMSRSL